MKKLSLTLMVALVVSSATFAQDLSKMMVGVSPRLFGPACTNCSILYGFGLSAGYLFTDHVVGTFDLGFYGRSESPSKINSTAVGVSGDFYFKEAYHGLYVGPDISYVWINQKYNGADFFSDNRLSVGFNAGWAISVSHRLRIIPHLGYGSWYARSKGKVTAGVKVGFMLVN